MQEHLDIGTNADLSTPLLQHLRLLPHVTDIALLSSIRKVSAFVFTLDTRDHLGY